jgi:hypothetical protein
MEEFINKEKFGYAKYLYEKIHPRVIFGPEEL